MIEWLAKRSSYVRALEDHRRTYIKWFGDLEDENKYLKEELERAWQREVKYSKLTLEEAEEILSACVDYHEALHSLAAADPIQDRVLDIFDKYGIKIVRNTLGDVERRSDRYNAVITGVTQ